MAVKAVELIVSGRVQRVGYRDFVTDVGRALKLVGFAENLKNGTVRIRCKGEAPTVEKFKELINVKNPPEAPLIDVESIAEKQLKEAEVTETLFEERYGDPNKELIQAISTGSRYMGHVLVELRDMRQDLGGKIDSGFGKMDANFGVLSDKYGKISTTMDHIDANIEKIATKKKGIFE